MAEWVERIVLAEFLVAAAAVNAYPLIYLFRPWYTSPAGRALMVKAWGNLLLVDMSVAVLLFGEDYPGRSAVRLIGMFLFACGVWYLLLVLLRTPHADDAPTLLEALRRRAARRWRR